MFHGGMSKIYKAQSLVVSGLRPNPMQEETVMVLGPSSFYNL
jgi:hypothetical protein